MAFIGLNPSTADERKDDPTIRRFARDNGCGGFMMLNLYAFRATDPKELLNAADPIGGRNDSILVDECGKASKVVAAWGAHRMAKERGRVVAHNLRMCGVTLHCLGLTAEGYPRHPLYVRADKELELFTQGEA